LFFFVFEIDAIASDQIDFDLLFRVRNAAVFVEKADYAPDAPAVAIEKVHLVRKCR
jgi:hypothetical protein